MATLGKWSRPAWVALLCGLPLTSQEEPDPAFGSGTGTVVYDAGGDERANAVTVDAAGNIYAVGSASGGSAFLTIKYSPTGSLLWARTFSGGDAGEATAVVVDDATGDVYVAGSISGGWTMIVIKYDLHGHRYGTDDDPDVSAIPFGRSSDIDGNGVLDYFAYGYNSESGYSYATGMVRDGAGNLYVTGWDDDGGGTYTAVTIKIDGHGHQYGTGDDADVSGTSFGNSNTWDGGNDDEAVFDYSGSDLAYAIARHGGTGDLFVGGGSSGSPFLVRYDSGGNMYGEDMTPTALWRRPRSGTPTRAGEMA
jgi:hypothetical protein